MTYYVLYNPYAGNGTGKEKAQELTQIYKDEELKFYDITKLNGYASFFSKIGTSDPVILAGGDGTINRFVNDTEGLSIPNDILCYAVGTGNDFLNDLNKKPGEAPFSIKEYLCDLPTVTVNGKTSRFLNGIGYGIDGYCCEVGDKLKASSDKPVNYAGIAIKGLLFHYHPTNATVIADGVEHTFRKVWLAPTMHGRYYGGGMMVAPDQDRNLCNGLSSTVIMHGSGKLKTLMVFPSIFKGEHIRHTEMVRVITGRCLTVRFDRPTALQIDGETILDVTEYTVNAPTPVTGASAVEEATAVPV